jgi:hypothetical protein
LIRGSFEREAFEDFADVGLGGGVVRDAKLPVGIDLVEHRLDGLGQQPLRPGRTPASRPR